MLALMAFVAPVPNLSPNPLEGTLRDVALLRPEAGHAPSTKQAYPDCGRSFLSRHLGLTGRQLYFFSRFSDAAIRSHALGERIMELQLLAEKTFGLRPPELPKKGRPRKAA